MKKLFFVFVMIVTLVDVQAQAKDANAIIKATCRQAALQHKKALIIFHASWCIWCHKLDSSINDAACKSFFYDNYIIQHITVFEVADKKNMNVAGGEAFLKLHHADDQGIPAWYVFDKDEHLLADSQLRQKDEGNDVEGSNIGCPSNKTEINYFISVLEKTSNINDRQKEAIRKRFALNAETSGHN